MRLGEFAMPNKKKNKVKFNICNVHYAIVKLNTDGTATFEKPVPMPGAVSLSLDPNGEPKNFYADGYAYYTISNNMGYDGDIELALIPESFRRDVLKETIDSNGVLIENSNVETENFAMYYCSASRPTIESQTNEDEIEVKTEKLTIKAAPLGNGLVKAKTGDDTNDEVYLNWYSEVYLPNSVIGGEAEFIAMEK